VLTRRLFHSRFLPSDTPRHDAVRAKMNKDLSMIAE
jgi:hypothetical protein